MAILGTNINFRYLYSATAISNLGDGISALAFPWLATLITKDPMMIAFVAFANRLPWLLFSLPAGVITDRVDRKILIVQSDIFRFLLTLCIIALVVNIAEFPVNAEQARLYIFALSGFAFLLGAAEVLRDNAAQTFLPSIVAKGELESANGQLWSIEQVMGSFVGPPLAGLLIAYSVPTPFVVDAMTFALAAWLVWCITTTPPITRVSKSIRTEFVEGVRWIISHKDILQLAIMLGLMNMFSTISVTILVLYSQEVLGLSAVGHGVLLTFGAAGGVVGGIVCPRISARIGNQRSLLVALALFPIPLLVTAFTSSAALVAAALFLEMFAALLWNVVTVSYRQRIIPDMLLGRVNSIYRFFGWGAIPIGALIGGAIVSGFEPEIGRELALRAPYAIAATGYLAMLGYALFRLKIR